MRGIKSGSRFTAPLCLGILLMMAADHVWEWTEHPLVIHELLNSMPEVRDTRQVRVEGLDAFLQKEGKGLEALLAGEEVWARQNLAWYRPLPRALIFKSTGNPREIRMRFCHAIRINPQAHLGLYLQFVPGTDPRLRPRISPGSLTFLKNTSDWKSTPFVELKEGEMASPLDIVTTATDEPDFGLDIGLYEDNGTEFGRMYGFGQQPFGNPNLEYSSQAPFHMGFYHEAWIVNAFAGFVKRTYPEYRIHLYKTLSSYAFQTGHPYWGWRFMGIGLHYLMDLTQPYHTTLLPGVSTMRMLWINALDLIGMGGPKADAIQLVSNRHTAIEKFQQVILQEAYREKNRKHLLLVALRAPKDCAAWDDRAPREEVSARSHALARQTDRIIAATMPTRWVQDPSFELGTSPELDEIIARVKQNGGDQAMDRVTVLLKKLLEPLPAYSCSYIRGILMKQKKEKVTMRSTGKDALSEVCMFAYVL